MMPRRASPALQGTVAGGAERSALYPQQAGRALDAHHRSRELWLGSSILLWSRPRPRRAHYRSPTKASRSVREVGFVPRTATQKRRDLISRSFLSTVIFSKIEVEQAEQASSFGRTSVVPGSPAASRARVAGERIGQHGGHEHVPGGGVHLRSHDRLSGPHRGGASVSDSPRQCGVVLVDWLHLAAGSGPDVSDAAGGGDV